MIRRSLFSIVISIAGVGCVSAPNDQRVDCLRDGAVEAAYRSYPARADRMLVAGITPAGETLCWSGEAGATLAESSPYTECTKVAGGCVMLAFNDEVYWPDGTYVGTSHPSARASTARALDVPAFIVGSFLAGAAQGRARSSSTSILSDPYTPPEHYRPPPTLHCAPDALAGITGQGYTCQ